MTEEASHRHPTEIKLHAKSRLLTVGFDDGAVFELPCEYLRVFSKAAEVRTADRPITGKEGVNISSIEPQGQYAIRVVFDDGHDTGIFSWDTLYALGRDKEKNWADYLDRLERIGYRRQEPDQDEKRVKLLYFSWLAHKMRKEAEQVTLPATVADVETLLQWLGQRKKGAAVLFAPGRLRVTVNKQFSEPFTKLHEGDEIGLVPTTPTAPATPDLI
ncbi:MAG: gamma-butyrobetaine hydroxylase-like domain-containing protein [Bdellovibrio bacteriovorus]